MNRLYFQFLKIRNFNLINMKLEFDVTLAPKVKINHFKKQHIGIFVTVTLYGKFKRDYMCNVKDKLNNLARQLIFFFCRRFIRLFQTLLI